MKYTYQDFQKNSDKIAFAMTLINWHKSTPEYAIAIDANEYNKQKNTTIGNYVKKLYSFSGTKVPDITSSNNRIASNFFHRLNVQRNSYSLGNGITFVKSDTKPKLGENFDTIMSTSGFNALIHGVTFLYWNVDKIYNFDLTEFVPLWDEETGELKAGIRFWQYDSGKPLMFTIYELDGFTVCKYSSENSSGGYATIIQSKQSYKTKIISTSAEIIEQVDVNYPSFPIIPFYGSSLHQSTLVGMKESIDSYDLIRSGFANDLTDCAEIYWLISGNGGMDSKDLQKFRDTLMLNHIALADDGEDSKVTPYTQEIPYQARSQYLEMIRKGIYEDFGAFDVSTLVGGEKTATEIKATYQPLDENADDYECQITKSVRNLLKLQGIDDTPIFKRNRIANEREQAQMVLDEAEYLDEETILSKLPNVTPEEIKSIMKRKSSEDLARFSGRGEKDDDE